MELASIAPIGGPANADDEGLDARAVVGFPHHLAGMVRRQRRIVVRSELQGYVISDGSFIAWRETAEQRLPVARVEFPAWDRSLHRSEEHTSELQSLMRNPYAVFCLKKKK